MSKGCLPKGRPWVLVFGVGEGGRQRQMAEWQKPPSSENTRIPWQCLVGVLPQPALGPKQPALDLVDWVSPNLSDLVCLDKSYSKKEEKGK